MPDLKITQLTDLPIPAVGDELPIAADPLGTPVTKKTKVGNLTRQILDATAKTANYTLTTSDRFITVDASGANRTVFVPAASGNTGIVWTVKKIDSSTNTVTIDPSGSETIDGAATFVLTEQNQAISFTSNGTNLVILFNKQDNTGGSPGGSNTQVQFNNSGAFGGAAATAYAASGTHLTLTALTATDKPLVLKGATSQTANLQEWQNSAGTVRASIDKDGGMVLQGQSGYYPLTINSYAGGIGAQFGPDGAFLCNADIQTSTGIRVTAFGAYMGVASGQRFIFNSNGIDAYGASATDVVLRVNGAASQTANLQEWRNSAGTVLTKITAAGIANFGNGSIQGTAATFRGDGTNSTAPGQFVIQATGVSNENCFIDFYNSSSSLIGRMVFAQTQNTTQIQHGAGFRPDLAIRQSDGLTSMAGSQVIYDGRLNVGTNVPSTKGLVVRGASAQTANLQEWQDSAGTVLSCFNSSGYLNIGATSFNDGGTGAKLVVQTGIYTPGFIWATGGLYLNGGNQITTGDVSDSVKFTGAGGFQLITGGGYIRFNTSVGFNVFQSDGSTLGLMNVGRTIATAPSSTTVPIVAKGAASQTGNLTEWQDSAGTVGARVNATLNFTRPNGSNAEQFGSGAVASGSFSTAIGAQALASNSGAVAIGPATASGSGALAIGNLASATGINAVVVGGNSSATTGFALGSYCVSDGASSLLACGTNIRVTGASAIAFGFAGGSQYLNSTSGRFAYFNGTTNAVAEYHLAGDSEYQVHRDMATISASWATSTDATRKSRVQHLVYDTASREGLRIETDGTNALSAFGGAILAATRTTIYTGAAANKGLVVQAVASQTGNFLEVQNNSGTVLALINSAGDIEVTDAARGFILKDTASVRWRITVDTTGALITTSL